MPQSFFLRQPSLNVRWFLFGLLAMYLLFFLLLPVGQMLVVGLGGAETESFLRSVSLFVANPLCWESLRNSILVAVGSSLLAACVAFPVAMSLWRFGVQVPLLIELFGLLPLFVPPFILSLSLQSLLGRGGALGMWLLPWIDTDPVRWGMSGVALIEAIHYFPLVLTTLMLSTSAFSGQAREAALQGVSWWQLVWRVFIPIGLPGLGFGMVITFLKVLDDLATPLSLGITNLLAPQAYYRVSTYGAQDPLAAMMALAIICLSVLIWIVSAGFMQHHAPIWTERLSTPVGREHVKANWVCRVGLLILWGILGFYALCYAGIFLSSLAQLWSHTLLPESYGLVHFAAVLQSEAGGLNTLVYCGVAALIDVLIGLVMAYTIQYSAPRSRRTIFWAATGLLGVPGVALAIAYLQFFQGGILLFFGKPIDMTGLLLSIAFSIRGLPFALRACVLALRTLPPRYLEAALMCGVSRLSVVRRIALPMMGSGLLIAFLICFGIAAVDLSAAMLLVPSETDAPISYSIYLHMQTSTGRGPGSALAILAIVAVVAAMSLFVFLVRKNWNFSVGLRRLVFPEKSA